MKMKIAIGCFLLAVLGLNSPQAFRIAFRTGTPDVAAGGGLDKTSLYAWYDFTSDGTDAHSTNDLGVTGSPTYTNDGATDYAECQDATPAGFVDDTGSTIGTAWNASDADGAIVVRWRARDGVGNGSRPVNLRSLRAAIRYLTSGMSATIGNITQTTDESGVTNAWYATVVNYDTGTSTTTVFINDTDKGGNSGTFSAINTLVGFIPGNDANHADYDIDYLAFYDRELTTDEITWLYNSGGTRTYSELSD